MKFNIDIHNNLQGDITLEDFSKDYGYYIPEGEDYPSAQIVDVDDVSTLKYKYSKTCSLNILLKVEMDNAILKDVTSHQHTNEDEVCTLRVEKDGYYIIQHLVLPTKEWYNEYLLNQDEELSEFISNGIYFTDNDRIYKAVDNEVEEVSVKEILERNYDSTTILHCKIDLFFNGNLQQCYINHCKRIYDSLLNSCKTSNQDADIYARDFIWMTLNIIDYLVGFKQFMEAERVIEQFNSCGGFCNSTNSNKQISCGCSKA